MSTPFTGRPTVRRAKWWPDPGPRPYLINGDVRGDGHGNADVKVTGPLKSTQRSVDNQIQSSKVLCYNVFVMSHVMWLQPAVENVRTGILAAIDDLADSGKPPINRRHKYL